MQKPTDQAPSQAPTRGICALRAALLAFACLLPPAVCAQESSGFDNEATMGLRYQSSNSALFGRYTGSAFKGVSGFGSFRLDHSDAWDSGKTGYFKAEGTDIDIDQHQFAPDASASVNVGEQGKWGAKLDYEGIPYNGGR